MSKLTFLSVVLMAAIIAGPAMAHERHVIARHATVEPSSRRRICLGSLDERNSL